jgi:hypothetical protein
MHKTVLHIFTFHDHFFKIVTQSQGDAPSTFVEDEYGTQAPLKEPDNLIKVREACAVILQGYREEMSMPGATS